MFKITSYDIESSLIIVKPLMGGYNECMQIFNTASRKIEKLQPENTPTVTFYTCGPTVYDFTHIGHMRTFVNNDVLKKSLEYSGYTVNHVMNITDVGHLTSDEDAGEDKMEKGAKKEGKTVWEIAQFYTNFFLNTLQELHISMPTKLVKATDHIPEMISLIQKLESKGVTYETEEALYFDVSKFASYGMLSGQRMDDKIKGAREEVHVDQKKKNSADFALWFKRKGRFENHEMHWDSPWGDGFPGWHVECSAMSMKYLGETIDIHTGGIEHIPVHHENEIAQSESATGKQFVKIWMHFHHLQVDGRKMSKSLNNFYTINDVKEKGIDPMSLRLLFMQTHYRQPLNFTWKAAQSAHEAYQKLKEQVRILRAQKDRQMLSEDKLSLIDHYQLKFKLDLQNDLQLPQAIAKMWDMLKTNIPSEDKLDMLYQFDQVLGLRLRDVQEEIIPVEIINLAKMREEKRRQKLFDEADEYRKKIDEKGYTIEDMKHEWKLRKK